MNEYMNPAVEHWKLPTVFYQIEETNGAGTA